MNLFKGFNIFKKSWGGQSFIEEVLSGSASENVNLTTYKALLYYKIIAPIGTSVDIITDEFASIKPVLYNRKTKKFEYSHPVLDLFANPNADITWGEFAKMYAAYYLLTGNAYIATTGNINSIPLELEFIETQFVQPRKSSKDNYIDSYMINNRCSNLLFQRDENKGRFRFYQNDEQELLHVKTFNPDSVDGSGLSILNKAYLDIEQWYEGSKHNRSVLKNGVRSSGVLNCEESLEKEVRNRITNQIRNNHTGSDNAAKLFVFDGAKFSFTPMSESMKDMDFKELKREVTLSIYTATKIPLPLINSENMTYSNYQEAKLTLYDNTVLPIANRLFEELQNFLFPRYKDLMGGDWILTYNEDDIPALEPRRKQKIEFLTKCDFLTDNEKRLLVGYERITDGDIVYKPQNLIPIGIPINQPTKSEFVEIMKKQIDAFGNRKFSDEQIKNIAEENFKDEGV